MTQTERYILSELDTIVEECMEKGITASEWVERYAEEYRRRYDNGEGRGIFKTKY